MHPEPTTQIERYRLLPEKSNFTVQAFSEGLLSVFGHDPVILIQYFTGEVQFKPGTFEEASIKVTVDPNALSVSSDVKEKDRRDMERTMRQEVLETTKHPEIVFTSSNVTVNKLAGERCRVRIIGDLTLHGTTQKNLWISAEATVKEDSLRAQGNFSLKQTDFGIKPYAAAGGTIKLKNELKFSFEIMAQKE